jgi:hypothetical protein
MSQVTRIAMTAIALSFVGLAPTIAGEYSDQVDRIPFRDRYTLVYELKCPSVIAALAIEPEQSARIAGTIDEILSANQEVARRRKSQTPEEEKAELAALVAELKVVAAKDDIRFEDLSDEERAFYWLDNSERKGAQDFERRAEKILRPEQMRRLREIVHRMNGPEVFAKSDRARFELTLEQKLKFDALLEPYRAGCRKLRDEYGDRINDFIDRDEQNAYTREHHRKLRAEARRVLQSMVALLTPRQIEIFDRLRGEDFDLDRFDDEKETEFRDRAKAEAEAKFRERAGAK